MCLGIPPLLFRVWVRTVLNISNVKFLSIFFIHLMSKKWKFQLHVEEMRDIYKFQLGNPEEKKPFGISGSRYKDNRPIEMDLKDLGWVCRMD